MSNRRLPSDAFPAATALAARLHARLLHLGWDIRDLAQATGLSRTTLHKLLAEGTRHPHRRTVSRIAAALGISPGELWGELSEPESESSTLPHAPPCGSAIDAATNPCVTEAATAFPALFAGWEPHDWDQLYSTFGTGGPLTPDGVQAAAARINRRRETVRQLEVVMETHLADVAAELVSALHRLTRPAPGSPPVMSATSLLALLRGRDVKSVSGPGSASAPADP